MPEAGGPQAGIGLIDTDIKKIYYLSVKIRPIR